MSANLDPLQPLASAAPGPPGGLEKPKLFVIAFRCGRLANRLALFANFIGFVEEHGYRLINFTFHSYAHLFEATRRDIYCQYPTAQMQSWLDTVPGLAGGIRRTRIAYHAVRAASRLHERLGLFGPRTLTLREARGTHVTWLEGPEIQAQIRKTDTVFVYGWTFRAPRCVERHAAKIRAYFRPTEVHDRASRHAIERLRQAADVVIGVHIRQGDYRQWRGGKYYFPTARYADWMRELTPQFPSRRLAFFVCSDEPREAQEFSGLTVGFGSGRPVEDLFALAKCDYLFGPPSSFSQWASFYGDRPLCHLADAAARIELEQFRVSHLVEIPR